MSSRSSRSSQGRLSLFDISGRAGRSCPGHDGPGSAPPSLGASTPSGPRPGGSVLDVRPAVGPADGTLPIWTHPFTKLRGETTRSKAWLMFRLPDGRGCSVLRLFVELGVFVGAESIYAVPAIGFQWRGSVGGLPSAYDFFMEMQARARAFAAKRMGCCPISIHPQAPKIPKPDRTSEDDKGFRCAFTCAWQEETRPVVDYWAHGAHDATSSKKNSGVNMWREAESHVARA